MRKHSRTGERVRASGSTLALPLNEVRTDPLAYESFWVLARRFMAINHLRPHEFAAEFARNRRSHPPLTGTRHGHTRLDLQRLAPYIGHTADSVVQTVPDYWEFALRPPRQDPFRYCPACLKDGYHSVFHEVTWLHHCPIHGGPLKWNCGVCNRYLGHTTIKRWGTLPAHFPCDHPWTPGDIRKPNVRRSADFAQIAAWTQRIKSNGDGERWYAVALDRSACLYADDEDFKELTDLVGRLGGFSSELLSGIRNARFRSMPVERESLKELRRDWFASCLDYAANFQRLECGDNVEMYDIRSHFDFTVRLLGSMGEEGLLDAIHEKLIVVCLSDRRRQTVRPDWLRLRLVASTFLKKHLFSMFWRDYDYESVEPITFLTSAMRLSGQPLGLLRKTETNEEIYWSPLRWGRYAIEISTEFREQYASRLANAQAEDRRRTAR